MADFSSAYSIQSWLESCPQGCLEGTEFGHAPAEAEPTAIIENPILREAESESPRPRQRFILEDTGFDEVPKKYRRFYRRLSGPDDVLAPNEAICPVCKLVIRSTRELREGDRVYCMPCMSRLVVVRSDSGQLEARVVY